MTTKPKKKMGRPRLAVRTDAVIYARCTDSEKEELESAAKRAGFRSFSDWVRHGLLRLARSQP